MTLSGVTISNINTKNNNKDYEIGEKEVEQFPTRV